MRAHFPEQRLVIEPMSIQADIFVMFSLVAGFFLGSGHNKRDVDECSCSLRFKFTAFLNILIGRF